MIDPIRHYSVFNPDKFKKTVDVIGAGAVGSRVVMGLAKLGISDIRVWDHDTVEDHNVANQLFGIHEVGMPKAAALYEKVLQYTGYKIKYEVKKVTDQELGQVVFLLTDTMKSRKQIWDNCCKGKMVPEVMLESRMGKDSTRVYWVQPIRPSHIENYEKQLYEDGEAEVSPCGSTISVGPTAEFLSAQLQWTFIRWFQASEGQGDFPDNEVIAGVCPLMNISKKW